RRRPRRRAAPPAARRARRARAAPSAALAPGRHREGAGAAERERQGKGQGVEVSSHTPLWHSLPTGATRAPCGAWTSPPAALPVDPADVRLRRVGHCGRGAKKTQPSLWFRSRGCAYPDELPESASDPTPIPSPELED